MRLIRRVRAWRRYRHLSRRLAELDRLDRRAAAQRRPKAPEYILGGRAKLYLVLLTVLVGGIGVVSWWEPFGPGPRDPLDSLLPTGMSYGRRPAPTTSGAHAFVIRLPDGQPVTYDACRPIRYVVNPAGMPPGGDTLITEAVQVVSAASGLTFDYLGVTDETPGDRRPTRQPERYGPGWAPVLIAWVDQSELVAEAPAGPADPDTDVEGEGGSTSVSPGGPELTRYVTGQIRLSRQAIAEDLTRRGGAAIVRAVIVHELGHVLGLDHVADQHELMAPVNTGQTELGPGDRQGFAAVGAGPCWH
ncbi:matrixin family metalloprotease [Pseudonocardia spinosispora]|uniref:matrixin family metalloprotease n=1 Tax=Pseudonocardia spinosispora TaxID=103441 RepID=UPI000424F9A7|nr:matrixin family metalloprotease [Pseudonocardia spinosispora]